MSGQGEDRTSAGCLWSEVSEDVRHDVEWMEGRHGSAMQSLPSLEKVPVPKALLCLPELHPDRPRGSKAMLDAHGARARLARARPGAWLVSPLTSQWWAKWPNDHVGWVPKGTGLPEVLRVASRNDLQ